MISLIINGFLKSGLSVPYFNKASKYEILEFSEVNFLFENFLKVFSNFSTT